jgi:hypothetical protein
LDSYAPKFHFLRETQHQKSAEKEFEKNERKYQLEKFINQKKHEAGTDIF